MFQLVDSLPKPKVRFETDKLFRSRRSLKFTPGKQCVRRPRRRIRQKKTVDQLIKLLKAVTRYSRYGPTEDNPHSYRMYPMSVALHHHTTEILTRAFARYLVNALQIFVDEDRSAAMASIHDAHEADPLLGDVNACFKWIWRLFAPHLVRALDRLEKKALMFALRYLGRSYRGYNPRKLLKESAAKKTLEALCMKIADIICGLCHSFHELYGGNITWSWIHQYELEGQIFDLPPATRDYYENILAPMRTSKKFQPLWPVMQAKRRHPIFHDNPATISDQDCAAIAAQGKPHTLTSLRALGRSKDVPAIYRWYINTMLRAAIRHEDPNIGRAILNWMTTACKC